MKMALNMIGVGIVPVQPPDSGESINCIKIFVDQIELEPMKKSLASC